MPGAWTSVSVTLLQRRAGPGGRGRGRRVPPGVPRGHEGAAGAAACPGRRLRRFRRASRVPFSLKKSIRFLTQGEVRRRVEPRVEPPAAPPPHPVSRVVDEHVCPAPARAAPAPPSGWRQGCQGAATGCAGRCGDAGPGGGAYGPLGAAAGLSRACLDDLCFRVTDAHAR